MNETLETLEDALVSRSGRIQSLQDRTPSEELYTEGNEALSELLFNVWPVSRSSENGIDHLDDMKEMLMLTRLAGLFPPEYSEDNYGRLVDLANNIVKFAKDYKAGESTGPLVHEIRSKVYSYIGERAFNDPDNHFQVLLDSIRPFTGVDPRELNLSAHDYLQKEENIREGHILPDPQDVAAASIYAAMLTAPNFKNAEKVVPILSLYSNSLNDYTQTLAQKLIMA